MKKAYLILEQGSIFEGYAIGATGAATGEIVFTTGVCGYLETLTDPCYAGQIVVQTFPLIGNYGVIEEDFDGEFALSGYVVRDVCKAPSNFRSQYALEALLEKKGIVAICGVDTREITRLIRENGIMNARICEELPENTDELKIHKMCVSASDYTCKETAVYEAKGDEKYSVTVIDCGAVHGIVGELQELGCKVTVVPCSTSAESILSAYPDGIVVSDGPGNPENNTECIAQIGKLLGSVPMFGSCLGHELIALAAGAKTEKLKYGHHGANQPVRDLYGTRTYVTTQNHCYTVIPESIPLSGNMSYVNVNDNSCEGINYPSLRAFSLQFRHEPAMLNKFIEMMGGEF